MKSISSLKSRLKSQARTGPIFIRNYRVKTAPVFKRHPNDKALPRKAGLIPITGISPEGYPRAKILVPNSRHADKIKFPDNVPTSRLKSLVSHPLALHFVEHRLQVYPEFFGNTLSALLVSLVETGHRTRLDIDRNARHRLDRIRD